MTELVTSITVGVKRPKLQIILVITSLECSRALDLTDGHIAATL